MAKEETKTETTSAAGASQRRVRMDTATMKSAYCNFFVAQDNPNEVVLNFGFNQRWDSAQKDLTVREARRPAGPRGCTIGRPEEGQLEKVTRDWWSVRPLFRQIARRGRSSSSRPSLPGAEWTQLLNSFRNEAGARIRVPRRGGQGFMSSGLTRWFALNTGATDALIDQALRPTLLS